MKTRYSIELFGIEMRFFLGFFKRFNAWKIGITNRCKDGQFVLFLDYDRTPLEWIEDEIKFIIKKYKLGDVHIFKTGKGYHCVNTEKRSFHEIINIMSYTSCDINFINVPLKFGKRAWTLRVSDKRGKVRIRHVKSFKGKGKRVQSSPHNALLRGLYAITIRSTLEDGEKDFYKSWYPIHE